MKVQIKLDEGAVMPKYAHNSDACMDVVATRKWTDEYGNICYGTGLHFQLPEDYVMLIFPRSSVSKYTLSLCNSVGILDAGYTGELILKYKPTLVVGGIGAEGYDNDEWSLEDDSTVIAIPGSTPYINQDVIFWSVDVYDIGDKVGQILIIPRPKVEFEKVDELEKTERGDGGFGSTGK